MLPRMTAERAELAIRSCDPRDDAQILALLQASLGWVPDDLFARFFAWKHRESPFGTSPAWVAVDDDRVVGFRTFVRWEFTHRDRTFRAVRAVDTATHPDYQGQGIFSRLTGVGLDAMRAEGVDFVFNTPNDNSRPGYIKMGWQVIGRLPASVRLRTPAALPRLLRARVPADKWSSESAAGLPAPEALADREGVAALLATTAVPAGYATRRSPDYLAWRYGFDPLRYRAILAGSSVEDGLVIFRVRQRGSAREAVLCDLLVPEDRRRIGAHLARKVVQATGADYALRVGGPVLGAGFVPLPRQGPILTWRTLADAPPPALSDWQLTMGDVELF
jgi:GNAT superfamily N-acetyltransferase